MKQVRSENLDMIRFVLSKSPSSPLFHSNPASFFPFLFFPSLLSHRFTASPRLLAFGRTQPTALQSGSCVHPITQSSNQIPDRRRRYSYICSSAQCEAVNSASENQTRLSARHTPYILLISLPCILPFPPPLFPFIFPLPYQY